MIYNSRLIGCFEVSKWMYSCGRKTFYCIILIRKVIMLIRKVIHSRVRKYYSTNKFKKDTWNKLGCFVCLLFFVCLSLSQGKAKILNNNQIGMVFIGEKKVFLDPLRVPGWVWKLKWQRQTNGSKGNLFIKFYVTWEPSYGIGAPKEDGCIFGQGWCGECGVEKEGRLGTLRRLR